MKLQLDEFDKYVKDLVSKVVLKETPKFYNTKDINNKYKCNVNSKFEIMISGERNHSPTPIIKSFNQSKQISFGDDLTFLTYKNVNKKPDLHERYKDLFKDIPELSLTTQDIMYASIYLTHKSNLSDFVNDIKRISLISPISAADKERFKMQDDGTLFIELLPNKKFALKYNSKFIAKCIVEDYIYHYSDMPGYENYKGAFTSFCYLIGHEIMHYRNNHFDPIVRKAIKRTLYPAKHKAPVRDGEKSINDMMINSVIGEEASMFPEYQNNALMSSILGVTTADMGVGRIFNKKEDDYSGLYSGYIKIDKEDRDGGKDLGQLLGSLSVEKIHEMSDNGWSFNEISVVAVMRSVNVVDLRDRTLDQDTAYSDREIKDPNNIIWPFITPYPTDRDIANLLMLFFLTYIPVSKEFLAKSTPKIEKGYRIGDEIIVKTTGEKGIITGISTLDDGSQEISVQIEDVSIIDHVVVLMHELDRVYTKVNTDVRSVFFSDNDVRALINKHRIDDYYLEDFIKGLHKLDNKELESLGKIVTKILKKYSKKSDSDSEPSDD